MKMSLKLDFEIKSLDWTYSLVKQTTLKQLRFLVKVRLIIIVQNNCSCIYSGLKSVQYSTTVCTNATVICNTPVCLANFNKTGPTGFAFNSG